jgi:hypothetical protein
MSNTALLTFTLAPVRHAQDLRDARNVRAEAYGHHLTGQAQAFGDADPLDEQPGTCVLLCRDKSTGRAIGTARMRCSQDGPLQIDQSLILPQALAQSCRAEITRLAVLQGADPLVRLALMKAAYLHGLHRGVQHLVIGARLPALIRNYQRLGFADVLGPDQYVPLAHAGGLPHRVLAFDLAHAHATWTAGGHPLLPFMVETHHPDIHLPLPPQHAHAATAESLHRQAA